VGFRQRKKGENERKEGGGGFWMENYQIGLDSGKWQDT
jgi:hypothetical protein